MGKLFFKLKFLIFINFGYSGDVKGGAGKTYVVWQLATGWAFRGLNPSEGKRFCFLHNCLHWP